jgi:DNA-binding MurR/RpiR family transcriptional regulator
MTRMTIKALQKLRDDGVKVAVLTCYGASNIADAAERYARAVRDGSFPAEEHSF